MENGETLEQAAARETLEEAGCRVELGGLFSLVSIPHIHQVHFFYRAHMPDLHLDPGDETLEAALFTEESLPWEKLAFRSVAFTLQQFFADRRRGQFGLHSTALEPIA